MISTADSSSSTFSLALACHGNNEAVRCLELGDYGESAGILANALRIVSHTLQLMYPLPEAGHEHVPGRESGVPCEPSLLLLNMSATSIGHPGYNQGFLEPPLEEKYMYMHAWSITGVNELSFTSETVNEVSMILVFNLALTFHVKALSLADNTNQDSKNSEEVSNIFRSTATLHRANSLYEKAYCLFANGHTHNRVNTTRAMAILNNLALTYRGLDRPTEADQCWRLLLRVVVHVYYSTSPMMETSTRDESSSAFGFLGIVIHLLLGNNDGAVSSTTPAA
jgi:hypothetical protein